MFDILLNVYFYTDYVIPLTNSYYFVAGLDENPLQGLVKSIPLFPRFIAYVLF